MKAARTKAAKVTKIEIEELCDQYVDGDLAGLFAEGEFRDADFLAAAEFYLIENAYAGIYKLVTPVMHARWRRHSRGEDGDELKPGRGRGSFLVTHVKLS